MNEKEEKELEWKNRTLEFDFIDDLIDKLEGLKEAVKQEKEKLEEAQEGKENG